MDDTGAKTLDEFDLCSETVNGDKQIDFSAPKPVCHEGHTSLLWSPANKINPTPDLEHYNSVFNRSGVPPLRHARDQRNYAAPIATAKQSEDFRSAC